MKNIFNSIIDFFKVNKLEAIPLKKGEVLFQTTNWNKNREGTFFTDDLLLMQMKANEISRQNNEIASEIARDELVEEKKLSANG